MTEFKGNLIGLNFNSIKEIVESSEWVKRASIKKVLPSTLKINEALALTSSKDILEATAKGVGPKKILVSLGYSGWGPGQLDTELASNSWLTIPLKDNKLLFDTPADVRFDEAFKILGIHPDNLSNVIGHA